MEISNHEGEIFWKLRAADFLIETSDLVQQTDVTAYRNQTLTQLKIKAGCDGVHLIANIDANTEQVIYTTDADSSLDFTSTAFLYDIPQTQGFHFTDALQVPSRSHFLKKYNTALLVPVNERFFKGGLIFTWTSKTPLPEGYYAFILLVMGRLKGIIRTMATAFANEELRLKFQVVFRTVSQGLIFLDNSGKEALVNEPAKRLLGLEHGREKFLPERVSEAMKKLIACAMNRDEINTIAAELFTSTDKRMDNWVWKFMDKVFLVCCSPFHSSRVQGRLWVFEDISDLYFANEDIKLKNSRLETLNAEKNDLISIVSHDLRSPLTQVKILTSFIADEKNPLSADQQELITRIDGVVEKGIRLIKDLLDISAIEQHLINKKIEKIDWANNIQQATSAYATVAEKKNITLQVETTSEPLYVLADQDYLSRIFDNLVSNAIKFSHSHKTVTITLTQQPDGKRLLTVKDQGQGIRPEEMKKLFGKFSRLSARPTAKESSTGLGLYIVKSLVEDLGGNISCESVWEEGTTFFVELPEINR